MDTVTGCKFATNHCVVLRLKHRDAVSILRTLSGLHSHHSLHEGW